MSQSELISIGSRLLFIAGTLAGAVTAASLSIAIFAMATALLRGNPGPEFILHLPPFDTAGILLMLAALMLGVAAKGWKDSALRRVLLKQDPSTRTDLFYFILSTSGLVTIAATAATFGVTDAIDTFADTSLGLRLFADQPLYITVPSVTIISSFVVYWIHRAEHTRFLWPLHAVHHTAKDLNIVVSYRRHPAALVFRSTTLFGLTFLGFPLGALVAAFLIRHAYTLWVHSDLPTSNFVERWIAFGPRGHGIHHSTDQSCFDSNYGDLVIWDKLFGTYRWDVPEPLVYGCADPEGIYESGRPMRDLIATEAVWLRDLWRATRSWRASVATEVVRSSPKVDFHPRWRESESSSNIS